MHIGIMIYTRAQWAQVKGLGSFPIVLNFIAKRKINKQLPGQGVATDLAHEHVHA